MGRSGFNAPVFSDSAVNQSGERSGTVGRPVPVSSTCGFVGGIKHLREKDNSTPPLMKIHLGTDLLDEFECYLQTQLYIHTMQEATYANSFGMRLNR